MNRTALALPLILTPGFAVADVTPEDVWDTMKSVYSAMGVSVTGTTTRAGETLTIADGVVTLTYPMIGGQASATLPQFGLIDQGDGTVRILMPDAYLMAVAADIPGEPDQVSFEVAVAQRGMTSIASGDPDDMTITTSMSDYDMIINALNIPGEDVSFDMEYDSEGFNGTTQITQGDVLMMVSDINYGAAKTRFAMNFAGTQQESTSESAAMSMQSRVTLPSGMDLMNLTPALKAGLGFSATIQTGASSGETTTMMKIGRAHV